MRSLETLDSSKPIATCEMVEHWDGRFIIGGRQYRPEWGRTPLGEGYGGFSEAAERVVSLAEEQADAVAKRTGRLPSQIRIEMYYPGKTRIIIQE
ncbi:MAG: hypothetical protein KKB21_01870 [Nanoarchaeota archaeon]|nr:hypothetical protein [Nanoarchaeota archaeon]